MSKSTVLTASLTAADEEESPGAVHSCETGATPDGWAAAARPCCGGLLHAGCAEAAVSHAAGGARAAPGPEAAAAARRVVLGPGRPHRRLCVEARVYALLRRLSPAGRRTLLQRSFTEPQRLALEQWILAQRNGRPKQMEEALAFAPAMGNRCVAARRMCSDYSAGATATTAISTARAKLSAAQGDCCTSISRLVSRSKSRSGIYGIECHSRNGKLLYRAGAMAGPFRITSGYLTDLTRARRYHEVLERIGRRVRSAGTSASDDVEASFRRALAEEPSACGLGTGTDLGFRFFALIPARCWVGKALRTPCFTVVDGLEAGLNAWRRLSDVRSLVYCGPAAILDHHEPWQIIAAWRQLREAYAEVLTNGGYRLQLVDARIQALEKRCRPRMRKLTMRWARTTTTVPPATVLPVSRSTSDPTVARTTRAAPASCPSGATGLKRAHILCTPGLKAARSIERHIRKVILCWVPTQTRTSQLPRGSKRSCPLHPPRPGRRAAAARILEAGLA